MIANNGPAADIAQLRSTRVQVLSALSGLRAGLRNTEYLNSDDQESAEIARLSRDNTLKQLEIQEKSIDLGKDLAQLNLKMSQINEAMMYPAAPYAGVVERVYVKVGQSISPGTVLATIKGNATSASAVALVSREVAQNISGLTESKTVINEKAVALKTRYVSQEATDGSLHSVIFTIPDEAAAELSATSYIQVEVPVGMELSSQQENFIPLDAVYQGQSTAYVYVAEEKDGKLHAVAKTVKIGHVFGHYVEVTEGLQKSDKVITNRNVIDGDLVALQ